uniref:Ectopic P granules protein 5 homolog isoform X2 n=1 Tax=Geotrypetes seraphini TaxID=260995 RepID=A0A6P8QX03_GEOSA|nr:ectopic P granules protein 5 homolog isoform X2 [Geotrypetes seraphini]
MAEAVRSRSAKTKPSRTKVQKKKKVNEESRQDTPSAAQIDKSPLFTTSGYQATSSSQECEGRLECPENFTEIKLNDEVIVRNVNEITSIYPLGRVTQPIVEKEDSKDSGVFEEIKQDACTDIAGTKMNKNVGLTEKVDIELDESVADCETPRSTSESSTLFNQGSSTVHCQKTATVMEVPSPSVLSLEELDLSLPRCLEAKEVFHQRPRLKPLYPELQTEQLEVKRTISVQPLLHRESLYPAIPSQLELAPFTKEQLKIFEPCSWLENVDSYLEEFESVAYQERHELHELLMNYWRCRKQLLLADSELQSLISDCKNLKNRLWSFKDEHLTVQGVCADQSKVTGYHHYQTVEMNETVLEELKRLFELKSEHLHQKLALHLYTSMLSRLQVEFCIYKLFSASPLLRSVAIQQGTPASKNLESLHSDLGHLKECISVLFSFTRRVIEEAQFHDDIHLWLQRLVSVLQNVGCPGDHLFLLNHILRCPAGVSQWAVPFIQIKVLENSSGIFHFMQALALLMCPVKNRADFMCHMKPNERKSSSSEKESGNWTLVDEGGEEDEDPETSWILLSEDDLIALLSQFPFHEAFQHLLGFSSKGDYFPENTMPQEMMKIFAFANSLVELLAVGLETFNRARYRQFVKRIGHIIRMTLCYVSDHWAQYVYYNSDSGMNLQPFSLEKLQLEYDELFLRAVLHVLKAKRLGVWLFMSEMPYGTLSNSMLWKLFFIMHHAESEHLEKLSSTMDPAECRHKLKGSEHRDHFEKYLLTMNSSEGICLLTTFAQMAQTKQMSVDEDFVKDIVLEIYQVAYINLSTRETFSKVGRELLATITSTHITMISVLLDCVRETMEKVGMVSLYLFKELPLHLWTPIPLEMAVIRDWLLNYQLTEVENKLACIILEGLNWGFTGQNIYHLDPSLHTEVALMVLEAYQKYITEKPYGGLISESIKQVSYLASVVRLGQIPETSFNQWAWDLVLSLKLHKNDQCIQECWSAVSHSSSVPDMADSPSFHPLLKSVKAGVPIGCYLALAITTVGHSIEKFCAEGIPLLGLLIQSRHLRAAVHVLDKILPFFYSCQYYLLKNEQFLSYIHLFLHLDSGGPQGVTQQVTQKVAQHLTGANYGENIRLFSSMIQTHVFASSQPNEVGPEAVLEFWVQVFTSQPLWHREKTILFLMDHLCEAAFRCMKEDCVQKQLYQQHKNALGYHCDRSLLSSLMNWIVAGNMTPSFIEGCSNPSQVWFSWTVLNMESIFEEDSQLRRVVERELVSNPSFSPDQALKKAQTHLKLPIVPSLQRLMIYRWAQQALATPADHPLLPLIWQKFFLLYLHRPGPQFGLPVDGCIGRRFFHSPTHVNLLKEMKKRLTDLADFHHAASKALRVQTPEDGSAGPYEKDANTPDHFTSPELHKELVRLFNVFTVWLEDESFQKADIYIPSLPKQYDTHRLAKIMLNEQDLWMEYVSTEQINHEFQEAIDFWNLVKFGSHAANSLSVSLDSTNPLAAKDRILSNLKKHDAPCPCLLLKPMKVPVPVISSSSFQNQKEAIRILRKDLIILQQHAKMAALRESQQVALDGEILDSLSKLYMNREEQICMELSCRGSSNKNCTGAANVTVQFEGMHMSEAVSQQLHVLRKEVKQLQAEATKALPPNIIETAVHVENFITALVNAYQLRRLPGIQKVGIGSFFAVVDFVCDETQHHPPTRQFFTSCVEILGQVFISGTKSECKPVLRSILQNRRLCNLLSPYFTPIASPDEFVRLYEKVVENFTVDNGDVIFMLLTKFDIAQWLNTCKPPLSDRTRLMESIHLALTVCGLEPDEDILMPFNIFCKHWTSILHYQFPDHYSDFLRLLMQSSAEQLLSPDCWKAVLKVLGCSPTRSKQSFRKTDSTDNAVPQIATAGVLLSSEQVTETTQWLSDFFHKLRLSKSGFRSFGLLSKWHPYMTELKNFFQYLVKSLIDSEVANLVQEPIGSSRILGALKSLHRVITELFKPWILVLDPDDASNQRCYPWLESDTSVATGMVQLFSKCIFILHLSFKEKMLPGHRGALWLHLMHYCGTCTAAKMPEFILYTYHNEYNKLPWKDMHPDQALMEEFFKDITPKCQLYIHQIVQFLTALEQNSKITFPVLEEELLKLLDDIAVFNPPDVDVLKRHLALSGLFVEVLVMMNNASVMTAESLRGSLQKWIDSRVHGMLVLPLLTAACQSLASVQHMADTVEACITAYFKDESVMKQNSGWGPLLASLQVPELTMEEFLQECLSLGSYLTLHVYILQCLNADQTLTNEMRILMVISKWLEQVHPSSSAGEAKLFLWWHKALQLSLIQMEQNDSIITEVVLRTLLSIQSRQSHLGEERLTSGILGAIGLGKKSPLSTRFRVIARSMSAFLLIQIPGESQVRLKPGCELHLSQKAQQATSALESMMSNKQYMEYQEQISQACQFIKYPGHCLHDGNTLLALLINSLYPDVHYLNIIR